jgi:RecJ-like exonuclease
MINNKTENKPNFEHKRHRDNNEHKSSHRHNDRDTNHSDRSNNYERTPTKSCIMDLKDRDYFEGTVKITRKSIPGPVIFVITDGFGFIDAVTKESDFLTDDVVDLAGKVSERAGKLQIEIDGIRKSSKDFDKIIDEISTPKRTTFSIKSDRYDKLKPYFLSISKRIRKAIFDNQPIIIRHHADSDGIIAGICIEQSCFLLMKKIGINPDYNLYRNPSKAPFYEKGDVLRDLISANRMITFGQKKPLIIILDNGSTPEDVFSLRMLHITGYECIVIDHHNPIILHNKKTAVCKYLSLHLNPYMEGFDGKTSAGMLAYEIGRFVNEEFDNPILPAIAAISDRCDIDETKRYIENSKSTKEHITDIGVAIDFLAYHLRFDSGEGVFEKLFENKELVEMINEEVRKGVETQLQSALPYLRTQEINGVIFSYIDLEKYTLRFTYPTPGKVTGMIHDTVAVGKENTPVITVGYVSDMIIIRATMPILPVSEIIKSIRHTIPEANVDGGGHECAGTIKFVSAHLSTVLENIKQQIRKLNYIEKSEK